MQTNSPDGSKKFLEIEWRECVKKRDGYACVVCGIKEDLCVHHIKTRRERKDLILNVENGITLCQRHHGYTYFREKLFENYFLELLENAANSVKVLRDNAELTIDRNIYKCVSHRSRILHFNNLYRPYRNRKNPISTEWRKGKNHWHWKHDWKPSICQQCGIETQTPSVRTRVKKFCSNSCQQRWLWTHEYEKMCQTKRVKRKGWARNYSECLNCKTKEIKHEAHGLCFNCFNKKRNKERYWLKKDSNAPTKTAPERDDICRTSQ